MPIPVGEPDISCLILTLDCNTAEAGGGGWGGGGGGGAGNTEMTVESIPKEKKPQ